MIHDEIYDSNYPRDIHYICDMTLTCNDALHCIHTGTSHFMGVSVRLRSKPQLVNDKWARYLWTKFNKVARLHDMENLCQVIARRAKHSLG